MSEHMVSFDVGGHRFQLRAAAVIIEDGCVLLHRFKDDPFWALPGGRADPGEPAAATVTREMLEETGERVACNELLFVVENFFSSSALGTRFAQQADNKQFHEIGLFFRCDLAPESRLRDKTISHQGIEGSEALEFRWFPLTELQEVNLYPIFLRTALAAPAAGIRHVVQTG